MITWSDPRLRVSYDVRYMADIYTMLRRYGDEEFIADMLVADDDVRSRAEIERMLLQTLDETALPMFTGGLPTHPNLTW